MGLLDTISGIISGGAGAISRAIGGAASQVQSAAQSGYSNVARAAQSAASTAGQYASSGYSYAASRTGSVVTALSTPTTIASTMLNNGSNQIQNMSSMQIPSLQRQAEGIQVSPAVSMFQKKVTTPSEGAAIRTQAAPGPTVQALFSGAADIFAGAAKTAGKVAQPLILAAATSPIVGPLAVGAIATAGVASALTGGERKQAVASQAARGGALTEGPSFTAALLPTAAAPAGITLYTPFGNIQQQKVTGISNVIVGQESGVISAYEVPYGHSISNIVAGGGPGAAQSGMFSTKPLTPVVLTQRTAELVPEANRAAAEAVLKSPESFSRLGAEYYGGKVEPLAGGRLYPEATLSRYPAETGNLANLVNPTGVNLEKQYWEQTPWRIEPTTTPAWGYVSLEGKISPISTGALKEAGIATTPAGIYSVTKAVGGAAETTLPRPFISTTTVAETTKLPSGAFLGGILGQLAFGSAEKSQAVVLGAAASGVDVVTGLVGWTPGKDIMQKTAPELTTFRSEKTALETKLSELQTYGVSTFGVTAEGKIRIEEGNKAAEAFAKEYKTTSEKYESLMAGAKEKGILTYSPAAGTYVESQKLTAPYGEFSRWSYGAGEAVQRALGFNRQQLETYGLQLEQKQGIGTIPEKIVYGAGYTLSTDPGKFISGYIGGAMLVAGGEVVAGGAEAVGITARLAALGAAHPTAAAISTAAFRYGVPLGFAGLTYYGASEGFTATPSRTTINIGKMAPELAGMMYGGASVYVGMRALDTGFLGYQTRRETLTTGEKAANLKAAFEAPDYLAVQKKGSVGAITITEDMLAKAKIIEPKGATELPDVGLPVDLAAKELAPKYTILGREGSIGGTRIELSKETISPEFAATVQELSIKRVGEPQSIKSTQRVTGDVAIDYRKAISGPEETIRTLEWRTSPSRVTPFELLKARESPETFTIIPREDISASVQTYYGEMFKAPGKEAFEGLRQPSPATMPKFVEEGGMRYIRIDNPITGGSHYEIDLPQQPMDLLPGVKQRMATPGDAIIRPSVEDIAKFGLSIEELAKPAGISMPSGVGFKARQAVVNPEIVASTRGATGRVIETSITEQLKIGEVSRAMEQKNIADIIGGPEALKPKARYSVTGTEFETALRGVLESEKRTATVEPIARPIPTGISEDFLRGAMKTRGTVIEPQPLKTESLPAKGEIYKVNVGTFGVGEEALRRSAATIGTADVSGAVIGQTPREAEMIGAATISAAATAQGTANILGMESISLGAQRAISQADLASTESLQRTATQQKQAQAAREVNAEPYAMRLEYPKTTETTPAREVTTIPFALPPLEPKPVTPVTPVPTIPIIPIIPPPVIPFPWGAPQGGGGGGGGGERRFFPFIERFHVGLGVNARILNIPKISPQGRRFGMTAAQPVQRALPQRIAIRFRSPPPPTKRKRYII